MAFRSTVFCGAVIVATSMWSVHPANASILLSGVVIENNTSQGSYSDQAALDRGNSGAFIANTAGTFYNGSGLLSSDVDGSASTSGSIALTTGLNTFYLLAGNTGETISVVNFDFNGANPDNTAAGISGQASTNGAGFTAYTPTSGVIQYTAPGGLMTTFGNQTVTLTNLQITNQGLGPFPNGTTVGYSSATGDDYTADEVLATLDVESVRVPEPISAASFATGLLATVGIRLRRRVTS